MGGFLRIKKKSSISIYNVVQSKKKGLLKHQYKTAGIDPVSGLATHTAVVARIGYGDYPQRPKTLVAASRVNDGGSIREGILGLLGALKLK